ncbi:MAG TPA: Na+/H+ antiporter [Steroidobacteraceae bacterium]|nr:Na+/H+ antiporter [Steroidobacteraceae bacterium]
MQAVQTFELVLTLLALVLALQWLALKLRLPPAAVLLVGGGALAFVPGLPAVSLDPQLALVLFLPPLLVQGAIYTPLGRFRRQLPGILSLAVGAVVFTTFVVGVTTHWLVPALPWMACFALGAIVSPPDAVAASAVLKGVRLPRRLTTLLEGESLLNDATGLILFRFAVAATLGGAFSLGAAAQGFIVVAIGGVLVGLAMGAAWVFLVPRLKDGLLIIGATLLSSWVTYLAGERLQVSGVIAVVVAGLVQGWYQHTVIDADVRLPASSVSRLVTFILEALVFILIGFSLRGVIVRMGGLAALATSTVLTVAAIIGALTLARFLWVFGCDGLLALARNLGLAQARPMGWRQATVLSWAGMRGVVTLAIALTLPVDMPGRDLMLICSFAVIFVTVLVQGGTLGLLIRAVRPADTEPPAQVSMAGAEVAMTRARNRVIEKMAYAEDGTLLHPMLLEESRRRMRFMDRYQQEAGTVMEGLRPHYEVLVQANAASRAELVRLHRAGLIEDEVMHNLERDLDVEQMGLFFQFNED